MNDKEFKEFEEKGFFKDEVFTKQELLEVSIVSVPALPQALITARKDGFEVGAVMSKALEVKETKDFEKTVSDIVEKEGKPENKTVDNPDGFITRKEASSMIDEAVDKARKAFEGKNPVERITPSLNTRVDTPAETLKANATKTSLRKNRNLKLLRSADKLIEAVIINVKKENLKK